MEAYETPRTLAAKLGITQVALRRWLRSLPKDQHEFAKHHEHGGFWKFSPPEAEKVLALYRKQQG